MNRTPSPRLTLCHVLAICATNGAILAATPETVPLDSEVLATDIYDAENLAFDGQGRLFVTGADGVHLIEFDERGGVAEVRRNIVAVDAGFVGLAVGPDGALYVGCLQHDDARVLRVDITSPGFPAVAYVRKTIRAPNGLQFDDDGTLYVADFGYFLPRRGGLWRVSKNPDAPAPAMEPVRIVKHASGVNGIAIDRTRGRLYYSRTMGGKVYCLQRVSGGRFGGDPVLFIDFDLPGPRFPVVDDLALDADGNLYICLYNTNEIRVVSPEGVWTRTLQPADLHHPTSVAFGVRPTDRTTLYITQKGRIMARDRKGGDRVSRSFGVAQGYLLPFLGLSPE